MSKKLFIVLGLVCVLSLNMLTVPAVFAQGGLDTPVGDDGYDTPVGSEAECGSSVVCLKSPLAADNITEFFATIIDVVLIFAVPLIVFFIIYAGFLYVTARGDSGTIERAHKALLYALIGGVMILGARVLIDVVQGTVDCVRDLEGECR